MKSNDFGNKLINYETNWFNLFGSDEKGPPMQPLGGDEEVKEGTGSNILILNKLLTRLSILLAQTIHSK